jgi:hypothetical protein
MEVDQLVGGHGSGQVIALRQIAAEGREQFQCLMVLDAAGLISRGRRGPRQSTGTVR